MAVRISLYPYDFGRNKAYLYLTTEYSANRTWSLNWLQKYAGVEAVKAIQDVGYIDVSRSREVRMSFDVPGTTSNLICRLVEDEIYSFTQLKDELPGKNKSARLKHLISYLLNFKKIQCFTLPGWAFTCITSEEDPTGKKAYDTEEEIDRIFRTTDGLESRFVYRIDCLEGADELMSLPHVDI